MLEEQLKEQLLPKVSKLPTEVSLETALKERFSQKRFNTAMQTLNQYGPKEGIRRLKESDPEIATQVEHLIQKNKESN